MAHIHLMGTRAPKNNIHQEANGIRGPSHISLRWFQGPWSIKVGMVLGSSPRLLILSTIRFFGTITLSLRNAAILCLRSSATFRWRNPDTFRVRYFITSRLRHFVGHIPLPVRRGRAEWMIDLGKGRATSAAPCSAASSPAGTGTGTSSNTDVLIFFIRSNLPSLYSMFACSLF
jgi:hypothetical protein